MSTFTEEHPLELFGLLGLVPDQALADAVGLVKTQVHMRRQRLGIPAHKQQAKAARNMVSALRMWGWGDEPMTEREARKQARRILGGLSVSDFKILHDGLAPDALRVLIASRRKATEKANTAPRGRPRLRRSALLHSDDDAGCP